jgi:hypothetical protein
MMRFIVLASPFPFIPICNQSRESMPFDSKKGIQWERMALKALKIHHSIY